MKRRAPGILTALAALAAILGGAARLPAQEDDALVRALEQSYEKAAAKADPSVVAVRVDREKEGHPSAGHPQVTGAPFNVRPQNAPCSGTVVSADGYVLTSYFNVSGKVNSIKVILPSGEEKEAKLLGYHAGTDVALLKIEATDLPTLGKLPLDQLRVGMAVLALGRAPDAKGLTANPGILSAPGRLHGQGIQTDARLNYGNVGGPLVDLEGRLVGVTCKVDARSAASLGQNSGVSFAVTWDRLEKLLPGLKKGEKREGTGQPFLGITYDNDSTVEDGVAILDVYAGGSAETAGIQRGDVILEFDGKRTKNFDDLRVAINSKAVGDEVKVKIRREEKEIELTLKLGERPGE